MTFVAGETIVGSFTGAAVVAGATTYISPHVSSVSVRKSIFDAYWDATIEIDGHISTTADQPWRHFHIIMTDHDGWENLVFSGFMPYKSFTFEPNGLNKTTAKAFSYGWFLTQQVIPAAYKTTRLTTGFSFNTGIKDFDDWAGIAFHGGTNNTLFDIRSYTITSGSWVGGDAAGVAYANLNYENYGPYYLESGELIKSDYNTFATMGEYLSLVAVPDVVVRGMLIDSTGWYCAGAVTSYNGVSSVKSVPGWADTVKEKYWDWPRPAKKWDAIKDICDYCNMIFEVRWAEPTRDEDENSATYKKIISIDPIEVAWFIPINEATTYLTDLAADVTITDPDPYLVRLTCDESTDEKVNKIIINNFDYEGFATAYYEPSYIETTVQDGEVTTYEAYPVEHLEETDNLPESADAGAKATDLLTYYGQANKTWTATFKQRCDLRLYQLIKFVGYTSVPESWLRISAIEYNQTGEDVTVNITCMLDSVFTNFRKVKQIIAMGGPNLIGKLIDKKLDKKQILWPEYKLGTLYFAGDIEE